MSGTLVLIPPHHAAMAFERGAPESDFAHALGTFATRHSPLVSLVLEFALLAQAAVLLE